MEEEQQEHRGSLLPSARRTIVRADRPYLIDRAPAQGGDVHESASCTKPSVIGPSTLSGSGRQAMDRAKRAIDDALGPVIRRGLNRDANILCSVEHVMFEHQTVW